MAKNGQMSVCIPMCRRPSGSAGCPAILIAAGRCGRSRPMCSRNMLPSGWRRMVEIWLMEWFVEVIIRVPLAMPGRLGGAGEKN